MNLLMQLVLVYPQYRLFRRVLAELKTYSDYELHELLGITRGDIVRFAFEEAEQHMMALVQGRTEALTSGWQNPALAPSG